MNICKDIISFIYCIKYGPVGNDFIVYTGVTAPGIFRW